MGTGTRPSVCRLKQLFDFRKVETPKIRLVRRARQDETRREHFAWRKAIDRQDHLLLPVFLSCDLARHPVAQSLIRAEPWSSLGKIGGLLH